MRRRPVISCSASALDLRKIAPDLKLDGQTRNVVVQFRRDPTSDLLGTLPLAGGLLKSVYQTLRMAVFTLTSDAVASLTDNPDVSYISPDRSVRGALEYATPAIGANR